MVALSPSIICTKHLNNKSLHNVVYGLRIEASSRIFRNLGKNSCQTLGPMHFSETCHNQNHIPSSQLGIIFCLFLSFFQGVYQDSYTIIPYIFLEPIYTSRHIDIIQSLTLSLDWSFGYYLFIIDVTNRELRYYVIFKRRILLFIIIYLCGIWFVL